MGPPMEGSNGESSNAATTEHNHEMPQPNAAESRTNHFISSPLVYIASDDLKPEKPRKVNQYLLGDVIGEGQYGKVREAMNSKTAKRVAIKKLSMHRVKKGAIGQVKQEVAIIKLLQKHPHKHVVKIIEVIEQRDEEKGERVYFVMELVKGGTLQRAIETSEGGGVAAGPLRSYFRHIMRGLAHIHEKGIVHRDVKPENVMITVEGLAKICDFGTAEQLDTFVNCGEPILLRTRGTPEFYAPEIASGEGSIGGTAVDVWAAGVTLFFAAYSTLPFRGAHQSLYDAITQAPLQLPEGLDPDMEDLLQLMLCKNEVPLRGSDRRRATVQEVLSHRWCNPRTDKGFVNPLTERLYPRETAQVDTNSVLRKLSGLQSFSDTHEAKGPSTTSSFADATTLFSQPAQPLSATTSFSDAASLFGPPLSAEPQLAVGNTSVPRPLGAKAPAKDPLLSAAQQASASAAASTEVAPRSFAAALSLFSASAPVQRASEKRSKKPLELVDEQSASAATAVGSSVSNQPTMAAPSQVPAAAAAEVGEAPPVKESPLKKQSQSPVPKEKDKCDLCVLQ